MILARRGGKPGCYEEKDNGEKDEGGNGWPGVRSDDSTPGEQHQEHEGHGIASELREEDRAEKNIKTSFYGDPR